MSIHKTRAHINPMTVIGCILFLFTITACRRSSSATSPRPENARPSRALELIVAAEKAVNRGDYVGAIAGFHEAIDIYQKLGMKDEEANAWGALAAVYMLIDSDENSRTALDRGRELAERSALPNTRTMIDSVRKIQDLMARGAPADELLSAQKELARIANAPAAHADGEATDLAEAHRAIRLLERGRHEEGRALLKKVLQGTESHDLRAVFYAGIGGSYVMQRNPGPAIDAFIQAVEELELASETLGGDTILPDYLNAQRKVYPEVLVELLAGQGRVVEALSYAERSRSRAFLQMIGNRRINPHNELLAAEMEKLRTIDPSRNRAELLKARSRYRELLTRVKAANPEYSSLVDVKPLDLAAMQREIPVGTTLIVYYVNSTTTHAWLIEQTRLDYLRLDAVPADLQRATCWARNMVRRAGERRAPNAVGTGCDDEMTAEEAHQALVGPLLPYLRNKRLIIVPHGPLHYIPFAALRNPRTKRYLVEDYLLTTAPSASALQFLRAKESAVDGRTLVIGNPATVGGRPLPGAEREAGVIASLFGTRPYVRSDARESLLYDAARKYDLIHIGAHGEYDATNPLFSRLVLMQDASHDGSLEVHEILSGVHLDGVNLVVLSACGSARGTPTGGDEMVGLTRAIHYAGSPAVISTLWDIDDEATLAFMNQFYGRLRGGAAVAESLRGAQLALLGGVAYRDPSYWAAFTLSGDPVARWSAQRPT